MSKIKKLENMTLDEAIKHCSDVIKENTECRKCMNEHAQLLSWLEELKELRLFRKRIQKAIWDSQFI